MTTTRTPAEQDAYDASYAAAKRRYAVKSSAHLFLIGDRLSAYLDFDPRSDKTAGALDAVSTLLSERKAW